MPIGNGSDASHNNQGESVYWFIYFDLIDPATAEAVNQALPTEDRPDKPPRFGGPFGCCVPTTHYFTKEDVISSSVLGESEMYGGMIYVLVQ
jgi:hypothetical protein